MICQSCGQPCFLGAAVSKTQVSAGNTQVKQNLNQRGNEDACGLLINLLSALGSVSSRTQLSLRCNFSDYVLRNNYMFRPMVDIFRLPWEYLRATVSYIARILWVVEHNYH
jgi:hypothetical protein